MEKNLRIQNLLGISPGNSQFAGVLVSYLISLFLCCNAASVNASPTDSNRPAHFKQSIGLIPTSEALVRAEAVTSNADGSSMAFYNPALLGFNDRIELRLLGIEAAADSRSIKDAANNNTNSQATRETSLESLYQRINSETEETALQINISALDLVVPWFSLQTFSSAQLSTMRVADDVEDYYDVNGRVRAGGIAGIGFSWRRLAVGISQYYLNESSIHSQPKVSVLEQIQSEIDAGTFDPASQQETYGFTDFTSISYGHATGRNVGAVLRWRSDNPTAIGYSVLNVGGTKMNAKAPAAAGLWRNEESKLKELASDYGVELGTPEDIPEIRNAGITLGIGGSAKHIIKATVSGDYLDIGGDTIEHKSAFAAEFGVDIPEEIANKTAIKFSTKSASGWDIPLQVGLLKAKVMAGNRPGAWRSYGWETVFHGGIANLSFLLLSLQGTVHEMADNVEPARHYGLKATLGLTLIY